LVNAVVVCVLATYRVNPRAKLRCYFIVTF
jgi:hypothetical protein